MVCLSVPADPQRAEQYVKEYRSKEKQLVQLKRQARAHGNFYADPEPRLAFVTRIRGYASVDWAVGGGDGVGWAAAVRANLCGRDWWELGSKARDAESQVISFGLAGL